MLVAGLLVVSYVVGSIPFSFLVVKLTTGGDIRQVGSHNVGATNVARNFGKLPGIIALLLDAAKGYGVVVLAKWVTASRDWPLPTGGDSLPIHSRAFWITLCALVAIIGHMFPVWLRFHGGKGVATGAGAFLALDPLALAAGLIVFAIVVAATRFVSLGSIVSAASIPVFLRFLSHAAFWTTVLSIGISLLIIAKHHSNIARLAHGRERRMGEKK
ncbi:MAG TPA: glycerol-3-phosphate 1-O-acyltransferase PlsY [Thermoanaerobaculia bacterium]|nr:glycerol-3-phosphate 1-O-acyltransferase PlsY [Thermoanaerobaculia bacterium]